MDYILDEGRLSMPEHDQVGSPASPSNAGPGDGRRPVIRKLSVCL